MTKSSYDRTRVRAFHVLKAYPAFRTVWVTQTVSQLGDAMYAVTLAWLVADLTGSKASMAAVRVAGMLPVVLCGLIAGVWVDRSDRRQLLAVCDGLRMLGAGAFAVLLACHRATFGTILMVALLFGVVRSLFDPAYMAYVPQLVCGEDLVAANSLQYVGQRLMSVVGPALAGLLIESLGSAVNIGVNALSFVVGMAGMLVSRPLTPSPAASRWNFRGMVKDIQGGFAYLRTRRDVLVALALGGASNLCLGPFIVLLPFFVREDLAAGALGYGIVESGFSLGLLAGGLAMAYWGVVRGKLKWFIAGHLLEGLILIAAGFSRNLVTATALFLCFGAVNGPLNVIFASLVQAETAAQYLGRVGGVVEVWNPLNLTVGYLLTGVAANHMSAGGLIAAGGLLLMGASGLAAYAAGRRHQEAHSEGG